MKPYTSFSFKKNIFPPYQVSAFVLFCACPTLEHEQQLEIIEPGDFVGKCCCYRPKAQREWRLCMKYYW